MKILSLLILLAVLGWPACLARAYLSRHHEIRETVNFVSFALALMGIIFVGMFVVQLFSPADVKLTIGLHGNHVELWLVGLVGSFLWLFISWPLIRAKGTQ